MKDLLPLGGIVTVLNTPFTEDDRVDLGALRANIDYALDAGVAGFLVPALASEVYKLTADERRAIIDTTVQRANGHATVVGGASSPTQHERLDRARECIDLGCDGVLVQFPEGDEAEQQRLLSEIDALNPPFLMIQDWDPAGPGTPATFITKLFDELESFRALKVETVPAGPKYSEVLEATNGRLHVSGGWAVSQMIEALDRGVHAFMPTGLHRAYVRIIDLYAAGDRSAALALHEQLLPILAFSNQHLDISIHFFKHLLHNQGLYTTPNCREPILPLDEPFQQRLHELTERANAIEEELRVRGK